MTLLVLSPHLDDAVLSVGAAMYHRNQAGDRVIVVSVCTAGQPERKAEDQAALARLGAESVWLDLPDAPERGRQGWEQIIEGPDDPQATAALRAQLAGLPAADEVWAPLGAGGHVDHRATTDAALACWPQVHLYEDRPYALISDAVALAWDRLGGVALAGGARVSAWERLPFMDRYQPDRARRAAIAARDQTRAVGLPEALRDAAAVQVGARRWARQARPLGDARAAWRDALRAYTSQLPDLLGGPAERDWTAAVDTEILWTPLEAA